MYRFKAKIIRVVDGDTYKVEVDQGFGNTKKMTLRLQGVDTPETWRPKSEAEREHGVRATEFVKNLIEGKEVDIVTYYEGIYARYTCDVILKNGTNLATLLKESGFEKLDSYED